MCSEEDWQVANSHLNGEINHTIEIVRDQMEVVLAESMDRASSMFLSNKGATSAAKNYLDPLSLTNSLMTDVMLK